MATTAGGLRRLTKKLDGVAEAIACAGTAIEQSVYRVRGKSFLFVQNKDGGLVIRLKLKASLAAAQKLAKKAPPMFQAGVGGWVTVRLQVRESAPKNVLEAWVVESHALAAGPASGTGQTKKATSSKRPASKKRVAKTARKKSAAKKSPGKKSPGKKSPGKKSPGKKLVREKPVRKNPVRKKPVRKKK